MTKHESGQPPTGLTAGLYPTRRLAALIAERLAALVTRQQLVLVVGPGGPGRVAALTVLAGPTGGGTMIDLGALWMAVDPPGERPRTVRLNGAPSAVGRRNWEAVAGPIGAVAAPPAVVLIDTFQGLVAALGAAGAAETIAALITPGRTVVVVLDEWAEGEALQELAFEHGVLVAVNGPQISEIRPLAAPLDEAATPTAEGSAPADAAGSVERRWRWLPRLGRP